MDKDADRVVDTMMNASKQYGIKLKDPAFLVVESGHVNEWTKLIKQDIENNGKPQIVVCLLEKSE